jgi:hypothetical protein
MIVNYGQYRSMKNDSTLEAVADELLSKGVQITFDTSGFPPKELKALQEMMKARRVRTKDVKF